MGLVPKELPSSEMGGLGEPRQLLFVAVTRVASTADLTCILSELTDPALHKVLVESEKESAMLCS
jgi:hypothetical protein